MKKSFAAVVGGIMLVLLTMAPFAQGQEGFIIKEQVVSPQVKYMTGGVGIEERKAMEAQAAKGYDLKLIFSAPKGNYFSAVEVKINDSTGKEVISAEANGPWFYARLPKGNYTVIVTHDGVQKSQKVTVNGGLKRVNFHWKPKA